MTLHPRSRDPLRQIIHHRKPSNENLDRFIPNRAAMDFDFANYMLTKGRKGEEDDQVPISDYRKQLAELLNMNRTRILSFKSKPFVAESPFPCPLPVVNNDQQVKPRKPRRSIPQAPEKVLDAPDILDDFYLNLLDWGSSNVLAIGLADTLYLWDASTQAVSVLMTVDPESGPIASVSWAADGRHVAVGLSNSEVELWDTATNHKLRTFRRGHSSRVGCLAWNNHILTTGGMDGQVINNDVRSADHFMNTYQGHRLEICGLKWSSSGQQLASGGGDNLLHIWDQSMASNTRIQWLHRLEDHTATVKALAWCPFQSNMIASGGGIGDHCIKFWNTHTGACLNSVDTGSQVCSILWNKNERELLSAHGFSDNQLSLWKYPSMVKIAELKAHTSRVLFMTQSPDGCTVATAAADETLRLWNVFGTPQGAAKRASNTYSEPFANVNRIR